MIFQGSRFLSTCFGLTVWCYVSLLFVDHCNPLMLGVEDKDHKTYCILLQTNITGTIQYIDEKNVSRSSNFTVPNDATTKTDYHTAKMPSHCGQHQQQITIEFLPTGFNNTELEADRIWFLTLQFNNTGTKEQGTFSLTNYTLDVRFFEVQNASSHYENGTHIYAKAPSFKPEWSATVQNGRPNIFTCSLNSLHLGEKSSLKFDNLKVVAFANETQLQFNGAAVVEQCLLDVRTSDLIPIIVGACLAGLVIIVLIAYLIGRARAKRQGYTSV